MSGLAMPPSLWAATAPPAPATPPLTESRKADVLIVGGGFTGLSAALHLAEAGVRVCVLEAHEPGWGASGRNGGQVNPTLKHDPDELIRLYGCARAAPLIDAVSRSADLMQDPDVVTVMTAMNRDGMEVGMGMAKNLKAELTTYLTQHPEVAKKIAAAHAGQ